MQLNESESSKLNKLICKLREVLANKSRLQFVNSRLSIFIVDEFIRQEEIINFAPEFFSRLILGLLSHRIAI